MDHISQISQPMTHFPSKIKAFPLSLSRNGYWLVTVVNKLKRNEVARHEQTNINVKNECWRAKLQSHAIHYRLSVWTASSNSLKHKKTNRIPHKRYEVMEKNFLILIQDWAIDYIKSHLLCI